MNELITLTLLALSLAQPAPRRAPHKSTPKSPVQVSITIPVSVTIQSGHDNMIFTVKASPQATPDTP